MQVVFTTIIRKFVTNNALKSCVNSITYQNTHFSADNQEIPRP